jgi:hypothetical protein
MKAIVLYSNFQTYEVQFLFSRRLLILKKRRPSLSIRHEYEEKVPIAVPHQTGKRYSDGRAISLGLRSEGFKNAVFASVEYSNKWRDRNIAISPPAKFTIRCYLSGE